MTPRRPRRSEAVLALAFAALWLAACGGDGKSGDSETLPADVPVAGEQATEPAESEREAEGAAQPGESEEAGEGADRTGPRPSDFARRTIPRGLLKQYVKTGRELSLEWWVIAAVDQIDLKVGNPGIPPRERIPGIGYSLAAAGSPYNNRAALAARAGGAYADRALKLAGRYVDTPAEQREQRRAD